MHLITPAFQAKYGVQLVHEGPDSEGGESSAFCRVVKWKPMQLTEDSDDELFCVFFSKNELRRERRHLAVARKSMGVPPNAKHSRTPRS
tara:strand:- start:141 stop:407 length:267 start_codon:yes stop_codon:yes gene_type:complete